MAHLVKPDPRTAHLAKLKADPIAFLDYFGDEAMEASQRQLAEINRQWARTAFSETFGMRSEAGKRLMAKLTDARHLSRS